MAKNPSLDGYRYEDLELEFTIDSLRNTILLEGKYSGSPKTADTQPLQPRRIKGECKKDGEFLIINYETYPLKMDKSRGFGVVIFNFKPSNEEASGFYVARSAKTGGLVCGEMTLANILSH